MHQLKNTLDERLSVDTGLEDISELSEEEIEMNVVQHTNSSMQTGVPKKDAFTSTGETINFSIASGMQTDVSTHDIMLKFNDWDSFTRNLVEANQVQLFQKLVTSIGTEKLKTTNLAWKSCLDMGVLSTLKSTTSMHYDKDCCEFFSLFYIMFGGSAMNVCGTANFGSLIDKDTHHGHYDPLKGAFNFAIPSINTLMKISSGYPKKVDVGFVHHSLDIAEEQVRKGAQFVLGFDGKMVAQGCKDESNGDGNLWGREKPSILSCIRNLRIKKFCAEDIQCPAAEEDTEHKILKYQHLSLHVSRMLRSLHSCINHTYHQRQKLVRLVNDNPNNITKYNTRMSFLHQNSVKCETVLKTGMESQKFLLESMVHLRGLKVDTSEEKVVLSEKANCFQLLPPEKIKTYVNLQDTDNVKYIKQRSVEWDVLRSNCRVRRSTLNGSFRLHGRGTGTGNGTGNGKNGLLYIMLYCSHCSRNGNRTRKWYNGLWTHFSIPDLCPSDVL